ncbi:MAG: hypothetical protein GC154_14280 [bacterium]|nr:hypothetical protein [bacterium]
MKRLLILSAAALLTAAGSAHAFEFKDGLEGPWVQPEKVFNFAFEGDGFDEDWFVSNVNWMGDNQFDMIAEEVIKTEGDYSQAANAYWANNAPRDLYLARKVDGLEPGKTYKVTLDWRFDDGVSAETTNHIMYDVRDGDQQSQAAIADIEIYGGHDRPNTTRIDEAEGTIGDGQFHTMERIHTASESSITFMMIVRFCHDDPSKGFAEPFDANWLYLDNFVVTDAATPVRDWALY